MWRWVIGVATLVVVTLLAGYTVMNARTFQLAGELVSRVDTADKVVALTFDDGPSDHTPEVLGMLAEADVPATFYLNGADLDQFPAHGAAIAQAGHQIGNHTYTHRRMVFVSPSTVADEVQRTDAAIARTGYRGTVTFRPPYCKKLWSLPRYLAAHHRVTVTWDVEPDSAGNPSTAEIVEETVRDVRPGSIILLHVMADSRAPSRAAVPLIIDRLRADGYRFVTVTDLLAQR
ncbi:polysaccharide deacetylase [Mycobacterium sp. MS1601]|nr:polysaccharide deacetylase [Mycobacterium sp. MS1601]